MVGRVSLRTTVDGPFSHETKTHRPRRYVGLSAFIQQHTGFCLRQTQYYTVVRTTRLYGLKTLVPKALPAYFE